MSTSRKWPLPEILFPRQLFFVVPRTSQPGGCKEKGESSVLALAQYDFAYNPGRVRGAVAKDPLFLGVFHWNDSEDAQRLAPNKTLQQTASATPPLGVHSL